MPKVGKKTFPYTKAGKRMAAEERKKKNTEKKEALIKQVVENMKKGGKH